MRQTLQAVTLVVPDYEDAIAFHTRTLRFRLTQDVELGDGKRWVLVTPPGGGAGLVLAKADGADRQAAIGNQTGDRVGFFLATDDFARDHADMRAKGVLFEEESRHEPYALLPFGRARSETAVT